MLFVTTQDERLLEWAEGRLSLSWSRGLCRWVAGLSGDSIAFVVVYSRFSSRNCELSIATDGKRRWASRRMLRGIFGVPFLQWGLRRVTMVTAADNLKSQKMLRQVGAREEGRLRAWFDGDVDGIVYGMTKEECRWIR